MCTLDVAFVTLVCCLQVWDMQLKTGAEKSRGKGRIKLGKQNRQKEITFSTENIKK